MIEQALAVLRRNMTRRGVINGFGREDHWEYPEEVVRELLGNAVMHRDNFSLTHGTQIRMEMYPDRLEVSSPGGLFGGVRPDELLRVPVSSSRNASLAKLLEDVVYPGTNITVCENRGTGLLAVSGLMRHAGLDQPEVSSSITDFKVTLRRQDTSQLRPVAELPRPRETDRKSQILRLLVDGPRTTAQLAEATGLQMVAIRHHLQEMEKGGQVQATAAHKRSRGNAWQVASSAPDGLGDSSREDRDRRTIGLTEYSSTNRARPAATRLTACQLDLAAGLTTRWPWRRSS